MKLSFSTLGCPGWSLGEVIEAAVRHGYQGVELRGIDGVLDLRKLPDFSPGHIAQSRTLFDEAGIEAIGLDSSARLSQQEPEQVAVHQEEARDYIVMAGDMGVPLVRVFGGHLSDGTAFEDGAGRLADALRSLGDLAAEKGVSIVLETHDDFLTGKAVSEVLARAGHEALGAIWDVSNCFWTGEPIERTAELLRPYLKLVHIKDSVRIGGKTRPVLLGEGRVPIRDALDALACLGYDGYLSLEWEKFWEPDIPEPEEAFGQYVETMGEYLG